MTASCRLKTRGAARHPRASACCPREKSGRAYRMAPASSIAKSATPSPLVSPRTRVCRIVVSILNCPARLVNVRAVKENADCGGRRGIDSPRSICHPPQIPGSRPQRPREWVRRYSRNIRPAVTDERVRGEPKRRPRTTVNGIVAAPPLIEACRSATCKVEITAALPTIVTFARPST